MVPIIALLKPNFVAHVWSHLREDVQMKTINNLSCTEAIFNAWSLAFCRIGNPTLTPASAHQIPPKNATSNDKKKEAISEWRKRWRYNTSSDPLVKLNTYIYIK